MLNNSQNFVLETLGKKKFELKQEFIFRLTSVRPS